MATSGISISISTSSNRTFSFPEYGFQSSSSSKGFRSLSPWCVVRVTQKTENYRSSNEVIAILNKLRSDIEQYQPPQNTQSGSIVFFYNPNLDSFSADDFIENNLKASWSVESKDDVKVLYLTHRFIAKENMYEELYKEL